MSQRQKPYMLHKDFWSEIRQVVAKPPFIISAVMVGVVITLIVVMLSGDSGEAVEQGQAVQVSMGEVFFIQRHPTTRHVEWLGTLIIWFLLMLSAISMGLMIRYTGESRRTAIAPDTLVGRARTLLGDKRAIDMMDFTRGADAYFARVLHAGLRELDHGHAAMIRAAEQTAEERTVHMLRRIEPLNIIGNVSPMIGLFGTVYGMILAFREIVASGGTPDPTNLAAGIGTALVTTFWGLIVAIPALSAYALLRNRIDELTSHAQREAEELLNIFRPPATGAAQANNPAPQGA